MERSDRNNKKNQRFFYPSFFSKTRQGQFYMIAAVILIGMLIGFVATTNYSRKTEATKVYDIKNELEIESSKELDRGALSGTYNFDEFTQNFSSYYGSDVEIIYIVSNQTAGNVEVYRYEEDIKVNDITFNNENKIVNVSWDGNNYYYKLKEGKNFYFLVSQYIGGERYIARN